MVSHRREVRTLPHRVLVAAVLVANAGCTCDFREDLANEAVLRFNLKVLREVVLEYEDPDDCLRELDQLVAQGLLRQIPVDPFAAEGSTWLVARNDAGCIRDIRSTSTATARDGSLYRDW